MYINSCYWFYVLSWRVQCKNRDQAWQKYRTYGFYRSSETSNLKATLIFFFVIYIPTIMTMPMTQTFYEMNSVWTLNYQILQLTRQFIFLAPGFLSKWESDGVFDRNTAIMKPHLTINILYYMFDQWKYTNRSFMSWEIQFCHFRKKMVQIRLRISAAWFAHWLCAT